MPLSPNDYHRDALLTNYVLAWQDPNGDLPIARRAFSVVPVQHKSDAYLKIDRGSWYRDEMRARPITGTAEMAAYKTSQATYLCTEFALRHLIDDQVYANNNSGWDLDRGGSDFLMQRGRIRENVYWASAFFKTGVWGTDWVGVTGTPTAGQFKQWDQANADPLGDIWRAKSAVRAITGYTPNVGIIGADVLTNLVNNTALVNRIVYTTGGVITTDIIASLFGLDEIIVPLSLYNTAGEGQTDAFSYIVNSKSVLLLYRNPGATLAGTPTAGVFFAWTGLLDGGANGDGILMMRRRAEEHFSNEILIRSAWDQQVVAPELGIFLSGVIA